MYHSLLKRQLKKVGLTSDAPPTPEKWLRFLARVNQAYTESDQDRDLLERSLMMSSEEMREVYQQLSESETRYALAAQGANDGLWDWNLVSEPESVYYSQRWNEILGIENDEKEIQTSRCWLDKIHPDDLEKTTRELNDHINGKTHHFQNEHRLLHSSGEYRWVLSRGLAVRDGDGNASRIAGSLTDITERKKAEEKMEHDAVHDALTGLPNRKALTDRLQRSIEKRKKDEDFLFAVLFLDLDRFKVVNDSMGHQIGDELLKVLSERLKLVVRPGDMVARLGGDEFVILIDDLNNTAQVTEISERILSELKKPVEIADENIYSNCSIGIVMSSSDYEDTDNIVRDADLAMYRAKSRGKGRYEFFDSKKHEGTKSLLHMEVDLRNAIEREEFILHYQPIVSVDSEKVIGFESLIRWQHPTRGLVPPNEFIPVAEDTGLIPEIGLWVLRESCLQLRKWQMSNLAAEDLIVHVNISAHQLEERDLVDQIARILSETGLPASCLKLEITESVLMTNAEQSIITVKKLRKMGIRFSIDDFGTGYSSLSYLHRFPIDTLKVDRSFINRIGSDHEQSAIVETIIKLASSLGMDVVAEGVETGEQREFLRKTNCRYGQGYFYSRPVDREAAFLIVEGIEPREGLIPFSTVTRVGVHAA